jgi:hypothetical protein
MIKSSRMDWVFRMHEGDEKGVRIVVEKPEGKRLHRSPGHSWVHIVKKVGWNDEDFWWAFMNTVINLQIL